MILSGIDEAGYGPLLGPLVVGCCAFELSDAIEEDPEKLPCVWKKLRKVISKSRCPRQRRLHVNDSKKVYSPSLGLRELERSILALAAASFSSCEQLRDLLEIVSPDVVGELEEYPWYIADGAPFPIENESIAIKMFGNALRIEMDRAQARCLHLSGRVVLERRLNRMIAATRNKASVLFSTAAIHIDHLLRTYGQHGLVIFCDRQGGREHYGHLLRTMFDEWSLEVIREQEHRSDYALHRKGHVVRIVFTEKAEAQCMPVAIASMLSKYLREALMRRFNEFWKQYQPSLVPTAGYYNDGTRFLRDIEPTRRELGIVDDDLVRSR